MAGGDLLDESDLNCVSFCEPPRYGSIDINGLDRGARARSWVCRAASEEVVDRLYERSASTVRYYPSDIEVGSLPRAYAELAEEVAVGRCQIGDPRRYSSELAKSRVRAAGCPFVCGCTFSWTDVQFCCQGEPLVLARRGWEHVVDEAIAAFKAAGKGHQELGNVSARLESNRFGFEGGPPRHRDTVSQPYRGSRAHSTHITLTLGHQTSHITDHLTGASQQ